MTTSSRYQRAEARHLRDSNPIANARAQNILASQQHSRHKRQLEPIQHDFDALKYKRARLAVEIPARPASHHSKPATQSVDARSHAAARHLPNPSTQSAPPDAATATKPNGALPASNTPKATALEPTKHQKKVTSGLKHELSRLQPSTADSKDQGGRKLRSQEGTRFKSELAAYFPDYDEVIGNDPKEHHILNLDTPIVIRNGADPASDNKPTFPRPGSSSRSDQPGRRSDAYPVRGYGDDLFTDLWESQVIDFSFLDTTKPLKDPLPDSVFEPAHRKAERLERSIRNAEKGRAQHERDQVIRLLEGLQGHDWLRVMGVSGITESKKKQFEPARSHFIKGCQVILGKFRAWAEEEKRLRLKKERAAAAEAEADAELEDEEQVEEVGKEEDEEEEEEEDERAREEEGEEREEAEDEQQEVQDSAADETSSSDEEEAVGQSEAEPPDLSDVDASIAKQLREEAIAAAKTKLSKSKAPSQTADTGIDRPKSFTSFFSKRYQREAAMSQSRRKGRTVMAFGQPIPEVAEKDFELPEEYLSDDTLKARERRKRREKRSIK